MKGSFLIYFVLVTLMYYASCSASTSKTGQQCNRNNDQSGTGNNGDLTSQTEDKDKIEAVLKNCTIEATEIAKSLDSCFNDFGDCILDLDCLKNKTCLQTKNCDLSKEKLQNPVSSTEVWDNIENLFDACNVNATKLSKEMNDCIEARMCLSNQTMHNVYQNLSLFMCNISDGFYNLSGEILKQAYPSQGEQHNGQCKKESESSGRKKKKSAKNGQKSAKNGQKSAKNGQKSGRKKKKSAKNGQEKEKSMKDCRINATNVCGNLENCIEKNHGVLPLLTDCNIDAALLVNESKKCVENIECLTEDAYNMWIINNSIHMLRISGGFGHLSTALWSIAQGYMPLKDKENSNNRWKCEPTVEPEPKNTKKQIERKISIYTTTEATSKPKTTPDINAFLASLFNYTTTPKSNGES